MRHIQKERTKTTTTIDDKIKSKSTNGKRRYVKNKYVLATRTLNQIQRY